MLKAASIAHCTNTDLNHQGNMDFGLSEMQAAHEHGNFQPSQHIREEVDNEVSTGAVRQDDQTVTVTSAAQICDADEGETPDAQNNNPVVKSELVEESSVEETNGLHDTPSEEDDHDSLPAASVEQSLLVAVPKIAINCTQTHLALEQVAAQEELFVVQEEETEATVCHLSASVQPSDHLVKSEDTRVSVTVLECAARPKPDEVEKRATNGNNVCQICLLCDSTDFFICDECSYILCDDCDSSIHSKKKYKHHFRMQRMNLQDSSAAEPEPEPFVCNDSDLLVELEALRTAATECGYTTQQLALGLTLYCQTFEILGVKAGLIKAALTWFEVTLSEIQQIIGNEMGRLHGMQCSLPKTTICSFLSVTLDYRQTTLDRCVEYCAKTINETKKLYVSLKVPEVVVFISENDLRPASDSAFYERLNGIVVESFLSALTVRAKNNQGFLERLLNQKKSTAECTRSIVACCNMQPSSAAALITAIRNGHRTANWVRAAFRIIRIEPNITASQIPKQIINCSLCGESMLQCELPVCKCKLCRQCLVVAYDSSILVTSNELSCPQCDKPAADSDQYEQHLEMLENRVRPFLRQATQQKFDEIIVHRALGLKEPKFTCEICYAEFQKKDMFDMFACKCNICSDCAKKFFEATLLEKSVSEWHCCLCKKPSDDNLEQLQDYFWFLTTRLRTLVSEDICERMEYKIAEWTLRLDDRFRWCKCGNGFIWNEPDEQKLCMKCPNCNRKVCFKCGRDWEEQHRKITCEQFAQWKIANDPEYQAQGLQRHLEEAGITCPNPACKFKYELARGGCMHFKCVMCSWEFCGGCGARYFRGDACDQAADCATRGLHCHCPRNCFSYLRDRTVENLEALLDKQNLQYRRVADAVGIKPNFAKKNCQVMEQKDNGTDGPCDRPLWQAAGDARLCELHYKEHLVELIRKNRVDVP